MLIAKTPTQNTEAYELYLKGRFYMNRRGNSILTGIEYLKKAIEVDPGYVLAYTGYASANYLSSVYSYVPGREIMQKIKEAQKLPFSLMFHRVSLILY